MITPLLNVARKKALEWALKATGQTGLKVINLGTKLKIKKEKQK